MSIQWNSDVYTQERSIMRIREIDASASYIKVLFLNSVIAPGTIVKYSIPASKNLDIDFSDLVRLSATGLCTITQNDANDVRIGDSYTMRWTQVGRINPAVVYIPPFTMPDALIVPPERILYAGLTNIRSEFYPAVTTGINWYLTGGVWGENKRWIDARDDFTIYRLQSGQTTISRKSTFQSIAIDACKSPAVAVRWVSFTGVQRAHHFMLRKPTIASAENYQLLTLDNSYNEIKGRVDSFDLYLDDLLPYDLWYYSDVITSSKVEVSLDGLKWNQVQVTNKNVTIPTGEMGNGKLEITVNWRKYDAVTM